MIKRVSMEYEDDILEGTVINQYTTGGTSETMQTFLEVVFDNGENYTLSEYDNYTILETT